MFKANDTIVDDLHTVFNIFTHEIRTGLNSAIGFAHLISKNENLPGTTVEDAIIIKQSAQNTIQVCNDYLEIFGMLNGTKSFVDEPREKINLQTLINTELLTPIKKHIEEQNEQQAKQLARFQSGEMDGAEINAIQYVMHLMDASVEAYFAQSEFGKVWEQDIPEESILVTLPPTPTQMALHHMHVLAECLGAVKRRLRVVPHHNQVELILELRIPIRNQRDCVAAVAFLDEMEMGMSFARHFENRRVAALDLWCRQIPAGLTLRHEFEIDEQHDSFFIELTLPIE